MLAKNPISEAWDLFAIAQAAEATIVSIDASSRPITYELSEGEADWYLVNTYPGDDARAFRWLSRRGFGVFQPMMQRKSRAMGKLVQGREPMFPGWLFVFSRDIRKNAARIKACPGVAGILDDQVTNRPMPVNQAELTLDKKGCTYPRIGFIDKLRAWSEEYNPNVPHARAGHWDVRSTRNQKRSARRLSPKERKNLERMTLEAQKQEIWDNDQWKQIMTLDPGARIGMLMAVLRSASDVGCSARAEA
jgi:hypothetical protein